MDIKKEAEPISAQDGEDFTKELASRDDYGEESRRGEPSESYHDWKNDPGAHVDPHGGFQENWNGNCDVCRTKNKKLKEDKDKVGRERMPESVGEGYWSYKNTPYVAPTGTPREFMSMPAQKMGTLKEHLIKKMAAMDQWQDHHISVTFEFMPNLIKAQCNWDAEDFPSGLNEVQTLARIVSFLEDKLPEAFGQLRSARAEDVDLMNRTVAISIPAGEK